MQGTHGYTRHEGCDHIFFVGFLGAGKSTVARNIGRLFHRRFVDTDRMVEHDLHKSIQGVFEEDGEEAFRDAETRILHELEGRQSLLVSCGGGIVERSENVALMHEMGSIVYLDGDIEDCLRHIVRLDRRPDLGTPDCSRRLFERWRPLYRCAADFTVSIHEKSFEEVAYAASAILWEKGLL